MDKKQRNLIVTIVSFIVIIVVAMIAYNRLKGSAEPVSFTPTMAEYTVETKKVAEAEPKAMAPAPAVEVVESEAIVDRVIADEVVEEVEADEDDLLGPVMPDIPLFFLDDTETSFDEVRAGRPAIVNYFASWCPPCKAELPYFEEAWRQYGDEIAFIFLDALDGQRETKATIGKFIKEFPFEAPIYWDEGIFAFIFNTTSLPTTVFFDKDGRIVTGYLGMVSEQALEGAIALLLK
ncbi:MAG TPA: TlpA disulfide reductase family protein [Sphaerochaeta sp.]|nr:TlpA disulfide reductase family protein [Sphaerochaeta sp.]HQB90630.1 TlpA disulfide reductase family protein [Sphaerochaeta sp.]